MRQVFSSARIENVEAVARMLEDAGIEVRISNGRSYRGAIRGNFSYRDGVDGRPRPAVWVLRSDPQPAARPLLREAGQLQATPVGIPGQPGPRRRRSRHPRPAPLPRAPRTPMCR